jgi:AcrR family transcriptional regulator
LSTIEDNVNEDENPPKARPGAGVGPPPRAVAPPATARTQRRTSPPPQTDPRQATARTPKRTGPPPQTDPRRATTHPEASDGAALRADARRNRARLLEAAEQVLAAKGPAASTDEIAKAAGVGIGTLFRHFPTKEALIEGVLAARMRRMTDYATRLAATTGEPGAALATFLRTAVEQSEGKNALAGLLTSAGIDVGATVDGVREDLMAALGALLSNAQQSGAVRRDLQIPELVGLLAGASRAVEYAGPDPAARARIVAVILDGLRAAP